jgi:hypothetical protein
LHHQELSHLLHHFPEDFSRENLMEKLSFAAWSAKVEEFSGKFHRKASKVGGFTPFGRLH